ncbi:pheromone biosynthesis activating neuropeptide (PBAN) domain-containing protein [Phthorimaea operculella]|nr:pheromone biosynthesis activating neuropeptide (PBAN) domain-containing protein [Phthorimaea operculella]
MQKSEIAAWDAPDGNSFFHCSRHSKVSSNVGLVVASDDLKDNTADRGSRSDKGGLWFGPRLGKRSDGDTDRTNIINLLKAAEAVKYYYDQMQNYDLPDDEELATYMKTKKKVIFTPRPGRALNEQKKVIFRPILGRSADEEKRYESVDFTPRLGRGLVNMLANDPATPPDYDTYRPSDQDQMDSRSKYSPRLGRKLFYSPRLGRDMMTFSPRLGRDVGDMTFSPRLGRDMTFSPRLGRELDFDVYPDQIRVARSTNESKANVNKTKTT